MRIFTNKSSESRWLALSVEGVDHSVSVGSGQRVLVTGDVSVDCACEELEVLDPTAMARVLAHIDHARATVRRGGDIPPLILISAPPLEIEGYGERWLIGQLASDAEADEAGDVALLARHLARSESYSLVRFLLEKGGGQSVSALAEQYGLSVAHFHRCCRKALGGPLKRELRVMRAARALLDYTGRDRSFTHLAADHGYASLSHFCTEIKALVGRSPLSVYRAVAPSVE